MGKLTEFELDLLRDLDGEDRGMAWGAAMAVAVEHLYGEGYLTRSFDPVKGISYEISELGREAAEAARKGEHD